MKRGRFAGLRSGCENVSTVKMLSPVNYKRDICRVLLKSVTGIRAARLFPSRYAHGRTYVGSKKTRIAALKNLLKERIVILDGAMGTMIQGQQLDEAAFRGAQFPKHPRDPAGKLRTC